MAVRVSITDDVVRARVRRYGPDTGLITGDVEVIKVEEIGRTRIKVLAGNYDRIAYNRIFRRSHRHDGSANPCTSKKQR
jgi:hypothetical protein